MSIPENSAPGGLVHQAPLSLNQDFLCMYDRGDEEGPFGPRYHIVHGWRVRGEVDVEALQGALDDVVARHEALRTTIMRTPDDRHQAICAPGSPRLTLRDLSTVPPGDRDAAAEGLLIEAEAATFPSTELPLLRAVLARFDDRDAVLLLVSHHTATDGWSMRLIIRDLAHRYAVRCGHDLPALPEPRQYREFAEWQRALVGDPAVMDAPRRFWSENLRGARVFTVGTDRPRSAAAEPTTAVHRFLIGADVIGPALKLGRATRSSPFMVLFAAFAVLAERVGGSPDVVVPTFTPGRGGELFQYTVGSFFNFMPIRVDLTGCRTFREAVVATRNVCVDAYSHDVPQILAHAPELMMPAIEDDRAVCVFQVFPFPFLLDRERVGDLEYTEIRRRLVSQPLGSDVPDGALWTLNLDPCGDVIGCVAYKSGLFDEATVAGLVAAYQEVLAELVAAPDAVREPVEAAA
ncbi:condensation domain-containing protein [Micromonospora sp. KC721]|uniref:condensation domain-containing protein n=1 Tax=Micromonospora sp. KC721 TaxID=2530380 RepID=UPI00104CAB36|nr:condensation domain-containing protein [Micromonospora sp. KC721]TDB81618.1 condensation protein [Micromonospora sp. KC721]